MPGEVSLRAGQYYAHPRNAFWRIVGELLDFDPDADYAKRIDTLRGAGVGLWDVLHSCERSGSLDSAIARDTMAANDFDELFAANPRIARVFFNGAKAEQAFNRLVAAPPDHLVFHRLPSTSPANASTPFEAKLQAWRAIVEVGWRSGR
jgi:double-stranded uracil-DNA glycosylase